jgi:hypothetical protein
MFLEETDRLWVADYPVKPSRRVNFHAPFVFVPCMSTFE